MKPPSVTTTGITGWMQRRSEGFYVTNQAVCRHIHPRRFTNFFQHQRVSCLFKKIVGMHPEIIGQNVIIGFFPNIIDSWPFLHELFLYQHIRRHLDQPKENVLVHPRLYTADDETLHGVPVDVFAPSACCDPLVKGHIPGDKALFASVHVLIVIAGNRPHQICHTVVKIQIVIDPFCRFCHCHPSFLKGYRRDTG